VEPEPNFSGERGDTKKKDGVSDEGLRPNGKIGVVSAGKIDETEQ